MVSCSSLYTSRITSSIKIWEIATWQAAAWISVWMPHCRLYLDDKSILLNAFTSSLNRMVQIDATSGEVQRRFDALTGSIENFAISAQ
jgi:hypothetical protein